MSLQSNVLYQCRVADLPAGPWSTAASSGPPATYANDTFTQSFDTASRLALRPATSLAFADFERVYLPKTIRTAFAAGAKRGRA